MCGSTATNGLSQLRRKHFFLRLIVLLLLNILKTEIVQSVKRLIMEQVMGFLMLFRTLVITMMILKAHLVPLRVYYLLLKLLKRVFQSHKPVQQVSPVVLFVLSCLALQLVGLVYNQVRLAVCIAPLQVNC